MESLGYYWNYFLAKEIDQLLVFWEQAERWQVYITPTLLVLLGWHVFEHLRPWHPGQKKWRPLLGLDLFWLLSGTVFFYVLLGTALVDTTLLAFHHALYRFTGITDLMIVQLDGAMPTWAGLLLGFLVGDFLSWGGHVLLHRSDFLWQFHKVHHSATQLDVWNAQRFHFGESLFWDFFPYLPLAVIGFPVDSLMIAAFTTSILSNFTHANVRLPLGPLRYVVNNPQFHIWHHAKCVDAQRNVNYGDALCVWDYLFRTAYLPEERENLELGFDGIEHYPTTIAGQLAAPFVGVFRLLRGKRSEAPA